VLGTGTHAPRSLLFVPGDRAEALLPKALRAEADAIILDLEDAVAPPNKALARSAVIRAVETCRPQSPMCLRVNAHPTHLEDDVAVAAAIHATAVVVPKAAEPEALVRLAQTLRRLGSEASLMPLIESAAGVLAAPELARVPGVSALMLGAEDLRLDLGALASRGGREVFFARCQMVVAARAAGRWAIDTVCVEVTDERTLARDTTLARGLGFDGKLVIHPRQVGIVNAVFAPSASELEQAVRVVRGFDEAESRGVGVVVVDGRMVDAPIAAAARALLARAGVGIDGHGGHETVDGVEGR